MLDVASEKLTERERECLKHFRRAQELGVSFAEYCRSQSLKSNEWHAVRHGMVHKGLLPGVTVVAVPRKNRPGEGSRDLLPCVWPPAVPRFRPARQPADCGMPPGG